MTAPTILARHASRGSEARRNARRRARQLRALRAREERELDESLWQDLVRKIDRGEMIHGRLL